MGIIGVKKPTDVRVRDYINSYGGQYGLSNADIGWTNDSNAPAGTQVLLGGENFVTPTYMENDSTWMDESALKNAIDAYAQKRGLNKPATTPLNAPAPYASNYSSKIDALLNEVMNAPAFSYDAETDPNFQSYKGQYNRQGDIDSNNVMADAASNTGGQLNSWAVTAGSQARQNWGQRLMDKIPELSQLAYNMYQGNLNNKLQEANALSTQDQIGYGRYRDTVGDFQTDRNFNEGVYENNRAYNRGVIEGDRSYGFNKDRANRADLENDRDFNYQRDRDKITDANWLSKFKEDKRQAIVNEAINKGQLSVSQGNLALSNARLSWEKDPTNPDNIYKQKQIEALATKPNYKSDTAFTDDISYINANPKTAFDDLKKNSTEFINQYGYDGYKELLRVAKPSVTNDELDKIMVGLGITSPTK